MREILFKAKRSEDGKWVEGYFLQNPYTKKTCIITWVNFKIGFTINFNEIDPETLCQYTGLKDKDGVKIWENDVISINTYSYMEPEEDYFGKVVYVEAWACWCIQFFDEKPVPICECEGSYLTERKVEGNVFDNPELLKEE